MANSGYYIDILKNASPQIRERYGVKSLCIFGSTARGENCDNSDIDIYVDMPPKIFHVVELKQFLQNLLGRSVDLVRARPQLDSYLVKEIYRDGIFIIQ